MEQHFAERSFLFCSVAEFLVTVLWQVTPDIIHDTGLKLFMFRALRQITLYSVIKKSVHLMITPLSQHTSFLPHHLAQSDCLAADRQGQGDTRLTLTPSVIRNSNYVIMVSD
jgi:hypothetical protein